MKLTMLIAALGLVAACKKDEAAPAVKPVEPAPTGEVAKAPPEPVPAASKLLAIGSPAPEFAGIDQAGKPVALSDLKGKPVVVYFYPKDDTPGCTLEAQAFQGALPEYTALGATVIGVSLDDDASHKAFADKHQLVFPLLADPKGDLASKFGVDTSGGHARRTTFVIDKQGKVAKVFEGVKVDGHNAEVLAAVKEVAGS